MLSTLPVLRVQAVEAGVGVAARADRAGDHPLPLHIALHVGAQLLDHANRLMANGQAFGNGVLALHDVNVRAANRRRRDPHQRVVRSDVGNRFVFQRDPPRFDEHRRLHFCRHRHLPPFMFVGTAHLSRLFRSSRCVIQSYTNAIMP